MLTSPHPLHFLHFDASTYTRFHIVSPATPATSLPCPDTFASRTQYLDKFRNLEFLENELEAYYQAEQEKMEDQERRLKKMQKRLKWVPLGAAMHLSLWRHSGLAAPAVVSTSPARVVVLNQSGTHPRTRGHQQGAMLCSPPRCPHRTHGHTAFAGCCHALHHRCASTTPSRSTHKHSTSPLLRCRYLPAGALP